ncbi:MAG: GtrA family protein [Sphingobium sp.]|nr:GtrA family protein [Sphingobium sp.]
MRLRIPAAAPPEAGKGLFMPGGILHRLLTGLYSRYVLVSAVALAIDLGLFLLALRGGVPATAASVLGYGAGIGAHWLLSTRLLFRASLARLRRERRAQKLMFLISALAGLALTATIVGLADWWHGDPRIAKLIAVAVSFQATYWLRRHVVFRAPAHLPVTKPCDAAA